MARECLGMHEIVGTIPFYYIINWRNVGFLCGAVEREVREPLRQTHLAIYPYSCAFINQCGWSKKQSKPPKRKKHDSCGLRETSPFLPPCKYAYSILLIHPSSFLYSLPYPPYHLYHPNHNDYFLSSYSWRQIIQIILDGWEFNFTFLI